MGNFKCCSACLVTDVKMFYLSTKPTSNSTCTLGHIFSGFLGIPTFEKYNYVCFECARLVCKFQEFKSKCQKAQFILSTLVEDDPDIIKEVIKSVDCQHLTLSSKLTFSSMITANIEIRNEKVELNNEMNMKQIPSVESIDTKMHRIHDSETIDEVQSNKEVSKNVISRVKKNMKSEKNENTLNMATLEMTQEYNGDECEIIEEYLELEEESLYDSDTSESTKEHTKDLNSIMSANENTEDLETVITTKGNNNISDVNAKFFEGFATVVSLTTEEAKKEVLLRKESSNYNDCPHKCDLCYRGFGSEPAYENHKKKHTDVHGDHECDFCHLRYPDKRNLTQHVLKCHKKKFLCNSCPYTCFNVAQATNHVRFHKGETYPCEDCGQVFSMPNSLLSHKRYKHQTNCVCEFCGDAFANSSGLLHHKKRIHKLEINKKQGPYCDECDIHFATEMAWNKHLVLRHGVSNGCKLCGEMFTNKEELKAHSKIHRNTRAYRHISQKYPVACKYCKKMLSNHDEFQSHMTSEHPQSYFAKILTQRKEKRFMCEKCGKAFRMPCHLSTHQRVHTGERPYACADCGKTFAQATALAVHRDALHLHVRHTCRLCQRVFNQAGNLHKHMKAHLNIRPYKCTMCEKRFINACDRKWHILYVHNKVPWPKKKDRSKRRNTEKAAQIT